jgi:hypothetical protein
MAATRVRLMAVSNEAAPPEAVPETVDALLSQAAPALTRQYDVADGLDQKALGILAVSGAVITIAGAGQAGSAAIATAVLLIAAAAVWVLVTAAALRQLWTRRSGQPSRRIAGRIGASTIRTP